MNSKCSKCEKVVKISKMCATHYHKEYREKVQKGNDKTCVNCNSMKTQKWYSGPICRKCYRGKPENKMREKEKYIKNLDHILIQQAKYKKKVFKERPETKIAKNLRTRLYSALKNNQKVGSAVKDLGCSIEELKKHLESQFTGDMSWDNYSLYGWHIDHIKPLAKFDLSNPKQFEDACHYTNLQPLWAEENLVKGAR